MATTLNHDYFGVNNLTVTNDATWRTLTGATLDSANFVANNRYLLVFSYLATSTNNAERINTRFKWSGGSVLDETETEVEPAGVTTNWGAHQSGMAVITVPATPVDLNFEVRKQSASGGTMKVYDASAWVLDLDSELTENTDWWFNEEDDIASPVNTSASSGWATFASVTRTAASGNYHVIGCANTVTANTGASHRVRNSISGGGRTTGGNNLSELEGEDTAEFRSRMFYRRYNLDGTSATDSVDVSSSSSDASHVKHRWSGLFVLADSALDNTSYTQVFTNVGTAFTWVEMTSTSHTPDATGAQLFLHSTHCTGHERAKVRVQNDGTTVTGSSGNNFFESWDARDNLAFAECGGYAGTASTADSIDFDYQTTNNANAADNHYSWVFAPVVPSAGPTVSPMGHQRLDNTYQAIAASRLNGVLQ